MFDPKMTSVIIGEGDNTRIETTLPNGSKYVHDDGEALRWVIDRHGADYAIEQAQRHVPSRNDDFVWP
jgi:hypothetical protein